MIEMVTLSGKTKIKVGLIVDEYFGAAGTAFGGYGFLARRYIAKYLPNTEIEVELLLGIGKFYFKSENNSADGVNDCRLPKKRWFGSRWLQKINYYRYVSYERIYRYVCECDSIIKNKL